MFKKHEAEIGVTMVPFSMVVYPEDQDQYVPDNEVPKAARVLNIFGTEVSVSMTAATFRDGLLILKSSRNWRRIFRRETLRRIFAEHRSRTRDNSNRIGRLLNLELWLRLFIDRDPALLEKSGVTAMAKTS